MSMSRPLLNLAAMFRGKRYRFQTWALLTMLCYASVCPGRLVRVWYFEDLYRQADLVVIAEVIRSSDTKDIVADDRYGKRIGVTTLFTSLLTLKGKAAPEVTVYHSRLITPGTALNGPQLVAFEEHPLPHTAKKNYLLFLRHRTDGLYEPVSGLFDPIYSVKELCRPASELSPDPATDATTRPTSNK